MVATWWRSRGTHVPLAPVPPLLAPLLVTPEGRSRAWHRTTAVAAPQNLRSVGEWRSTAQRKTLGHAGPPWSGTADHRPDVRNRLGANARGRPQHRHHRADGSDGAGLHLHARASAVAGGAWCARGRPWLGLASKGGRDCIGAAGDQKGELGSPFFSWRDPKNWVRCAAYSRNLGNTLVPL